MTFNITNDTIYLTRYQYSPNRREQIDISYDYYTAPATRYSKKTVTDYASSGAILSEKQFDYSDNLITQIDYTYDVNGKLVKKYTATAPAYTSEERYFINAATGKYDKMEFYSNGNLATTRTYYYQ